MHTTFKLLEQEKIEIESEIGEALDWQELPNRKMSRIALTKLGSNPRNTSEWPGQHAWLADMLENMHRVFAPRIRTLDADDFEPEDDGEDEAAR